MAHLRAELDLGAGSRIATLDTSKTPETGQTRIAVKESEALLKELNAIIENDGSRCRRVSGCRAEFAKLPGSPPAANRRDR